jgi:hypothetical protein
MEAYHAGQRHFGENYVRLWHSAVDTILIVPYISLLQQVQELSEKASNPEVRLFNCSMFDQRWSID